MKPYLETQLTFSSLTAKGLGDGMWGTYFFLATTSNNMTFLSSGV